VIETRDHIRVYRKCLKDKEPRIRELALKNLAELDAEDLVGLETEIRNLVSDPEMKVKQAAVRALKKMNL
jgi:vesicle coat complex subunit